MTTLVSALTKLIRFPDAIANYFIADVHVGMLFIITVSAAVFAVYTDDLIKRIKKLPGGIELSTGGGIADLLSAPALPTLPVPALPEEGAQPALTPLEERYYEKGVQIFWQLELSALDPSKLEGRERANYVEVIVKTGKYALAKEDFFKAIDLLKKLEEVQPLPKRELRFLGTAYLWASGNPTLDEKQKRNYLLEAVRLYELALQEEKYDPDVLYNLAWAYDELGLYDEAIAAYRKAIITGRHLEVFAGAMYNIAVSLIKKNAFSEALQELEKIPAGATWGRDKIWKLAKTDTDMVPLRDHPEYGEAFRNLVRARTLGLE